MTNALTRQEVCDRTFTHLRSMPERSRARGVCAYRSAVGHCAVGFWLMEVPGYPMRALIASVDDLPGVYVDQLRAIHDDIEIFALLQVLHDQWSNWNGDGIQEYAIERFCKDRKITYNPPEAL
jgi:hypothetical protein